MNPPKRALHSVIAKVPKVSGKLREYALSLAADPSDIVNRTHARLLETEEAYSRLQSSVRHDVLQFLEYCARLWFESILNGTFPTQAEMEILASTGRRRVHQGVALSSLLRAFRFGGLEVWGAFLTFARQDGDSHDSLLFDISHYLLESFDIMSQTIAHAYLDEQYQRTRWRDSLRFELCSAVFRVPEDPETFHNCAEALGLDPTAARIALAFELKPTKGGPSRLEGELDRLTLSAARHFKAAHDDLVRVFHRGRLVMWVPCIRGDSLVACERRVSEYALTFIKATPEILGVGVGLMNQGPAGWAVSVDEAFKALESGARGQSGKRIHFYSDIAVNESVRRTDNVLRYLNCIIEKLSEEPELLSTLQTYFEQLQRRKVTADVLGIHPNTLNHRLERIESLLGAQLDDAGWIAKLHVAVKLRQLSTPSPDVTS